jgi:hypothetical protein
MALTLTLMCQRKCALALALIYAPLLWRADKNSASDHVRLISITKIKFHPAIRHDFLCSKLGLCSPFA